MSGSSQKRLKGWWYLTFALALTAGVLGLLLGMSLQADGNETSVDHTHTYKGVLTISEDPYHQTNYSVRGWGEPCEHEGGYSCDDGNISRKVRDRWGIYLGHRTVLEVDWSCDPPAGIPAEVDATSTSGSESYTYEGRGEHSRANFSVPSFTCGSWRVSHQATTTTTTAPSTTTTTAPSTTTTRVTLPESPCLGDWWWDGAFCQPPSTTTSTTERYRAEGSWGSCAFTWRVGDTIVAGGLFDPNVVSSHRRFTGVRLPLFSGANKNLPGYYFSGSVPPGMRWTHLDRYVHSGHTFGWGIGVWGSPTTAGTWTGNLYVSGNYGTGWRNSDASTRCSFTVLPALVPGEGPVRACTAAVSEGVLEGVRGLVSWRTNFVPVDDGSGVDLEAAMRELGVLESPAFPSAVAAGGLGDPDYDFRVWPFWPPDRIGLADVVDTAECSWGARRVITRMWPRVMWRAGDVATVREVRPEVASVWEGQGKRFRDRVRGEFEARWRRAGWSESVAVPSREVPVGSVCDLLGRAGESGEELSDRLKLECFWWVPVEGVYSWETVVEYITSDHSDGIRRRGELVLYEGSGWVGGGHPGIIRIIPGGAFVR